MKYYSYIRVSTTTQDYDRQFIQLQDWCNKENINMDDVVLYSEKRTGTNYNRPEFIKLMKEMKLHRSKEECCLVLIENTRLGRGYSSNQKMFQELKDNNIYFVVATVPLLDTRPKENNPAQALVIDIVLSVYNWIAESEHKTLMERTNAGRESAKARGVKFGRKEKTLKDINPIILKELKQWKKEPWGKFVDFVAVVNRKLDSKGCKNVSRASLYNYLEMLNKESI